MAVGMFSTRYERYERDASPPHKYPLLVTVPSGPVQPVLTSTEQAIEDVDMDIDHEGGPSTPPTVHKGVACLAIDTNVLMNDLYLVKELYRALKATSEASLQLLIPSVVINELDGLTQSQAPAGTTPEGDVTVGDLARRATAWLLDVKRSERDNHRRAVLRTQRWTERVHHKLDKPDDRILDCCLHFRAQPSAPAVRLWTNDRNLSLLAETNDIETMSGRNLTVNSILRPFSISPPRSQISSPLPDIPANDDHDMELDIDLPSTPLHDLSTPLRSSSSTSTSSTPPTSLARSARSTPTSRLPPRIPDTTLSTITTIISPVLQHLSPDTLRKDDALYTLRTLRETLLKIEETTTGPMDMVHYELLRLIEALRIVVLYLDDGKERKPRIGEVADAVVSMAELMTSLNILPAGREELCAVAETIRML